MIQDSIIYSFLLHFKLLGSLLTHRFLVALFEIDKFLRNRNSTAWKTEETSHFSCISCWFSSYLDDHHPLLRSLTDAPNFYEIFPENNLNTYQLELLEELKEYLYLKIYWIIMAQHHLAYPDLALDNFSSNDPDRYAGAFIHLVECKKSYGLGTQPDPADAEHIIYLFRKKP